MGRSLPMGRNAKQRSRSRPRLGRNLRTRRIVRGKGAVPKTFARRNRPSTEGGALKWDALHQVFFERIKPAVVAHSARQDWVGLVAFLGLGLVCQLI